MRPAQAETVVDVTEVIERTGLGGFQLRAFSVVAACLVMDGFDLQAMGYAAPALLQDWKLAPATMSRPSTWAAKARMSTCSVGGAPRWCRSARAMARRWAESVPPERRVQTASW